MRNASYWAPRARAPPPAQASGCGEAHAVIDFWGGSGSDGSGSIKVCASIGVATAAVAVRAVPTGAGHGTASAAGPKVQKADGVCKEHILLNVKVCDWSAGAGTDEDVCVTAEATASAQTAVGVGYPAPSHGAAAARAGDLKHIKGLLKPTDGTMNLLAWEKREGRSVPLSALPIGVQAKFRPAVGADVLRSSGIDSAAPIGIGTVVDPAGCLGGRPRSRGRQGLGRPRDPFVRPAASLFPSDQFGGSFAVPAQKSWISRTTRL